MADDQFSLHIDSDWKKQAQEEKRRLAEEAEQKRAKAAANPAPSAMSSLAPGDSAGGFAPEQSSSRSRSGRPRRELPPPTFPSLVQSMVTQVLYHLGDLSPQGAEPPLNLDMAKHQMDLLNMLEEKTVNNLTAEEKDVLDHGLYETRMRYVSVASQFI